MTRPAPLALEKLHATFAPHKLPWKSSAEIPARHASKNSRDIFQPRVMQALDLGLLIGAPDYHIYLSGEANLGRRQILMDYLVPRARAMATPPDLIFAPNFSDSDSPLLFELEAGKGKLLKKDIAKLIEEIGDLLEQRLDSGGALSKKLTLSERFQEQKEKLVSEMNEIAKKSGFNLDIDRDGEISVCPIIKGKRISEDAFNELPPHKRLEYKTRGESLARKLNPWFHRLNRDEEKLHEEERKIELDTLSDLVNELIAPITSQYPALAHFFEDLGRDIKANSEAFFPTDARKEEPRPHGVSKRYAINVLVDNSALQGAPVIMEEFPSVPNLLGSIERESEMGSLVTDHTLIRAGSLQRANGGFLILRAEDLLNNPGAWDGLLRHLRKNESSIEDGESPENLRPKTLRPQAVPLKLRVILIGSEELYENLLEYDELFGKLFRIKAHMTDSAMRTSANIRHYLLRIGSIIRSENLLLFESDALAWLIDLGSHLCEDQKKISLRFPLLREIMIEASANARASDLKSVTGALLEQTYALRAWRASLAEEEFMEEYDREIIKVSTSGTAIGQVNGLSVLQEGNYEFGLPHRISCSVGVGHDGIVDLEREAELGGPIHTKAMMILKSYLTNMFASKRPLALSASLHFEQSYGGIEGDSASGAELAALLSALAQTPARLDLAFTGAVSHSGQIMAVGGVTHKIEGFYKVCARHGLTGSQGVIIPRDNIAHLMLSPEILESVSQGKFSIYAVSTIEEAMELLTDLPAGKRRKDGRFTRGSLYDRVDRRLEELGYHGQSAFTAKRAGRSS